jgi:hypothetical protein
LNDDEPPEVVVVVLLDIGDVDDVFTEFVLKPKLFAGIRIRLEFVSKNDIFVVSVC